MSHLNFKFVRPVNLVNLQPISFSCYLYVVIDFFIRINELNAFDYVI